MPSQSAVNSLLCLKQRYLKWWGLAGALMPVHGTVLYSVLPNPRSRRAGNGNQQTQRFAFCVTFLCRPNRRLPSQLCFPRRVRVAAPPIALRPRKKSGLLPAVRSQITHQGISADKMRGGLTLNPPLPCRGIPDQLG